MVGVEKLEVGEVEHGEASSGGGGSDDKHDDYLVAHGRIGGGAAEDLAGHHAGEADHAHHRHAVERWDQRGA